MCLNWPRFGHEKASRVESRFDDSEATARSERLSASPTTVSRPFPRRMSQLPYPGGMTSEDGDAGLELPLPPTPPRRFGQLPDLAVPDDFDEPLPPTEAAVWEGPDPADEDTSAALDDDDWPIGEADFREALQESEADLAAGGTFSEEEIRARYGIPRPDTNG